MFFDRVTRILSEYHTEILNGILVTLYLSLLGTIIGLAIALLLGTFKFATIADDDPLIKRILKKMGNTIINVYVVVIRGTPMMVQACLFYYGLPFVIGIEMTALQAGLFTVSFNTGAYLTEVVLDGFRSVDKGQYEAGYSLGLSRFRIMWHLIFPQGLKTQIASIGNEFIINIKDTSVLSVIVVVDVFRVTKMISDKKYWYLESMMIAAVIYLILTFFTSMALKMLTKKLGAPSKEITSSN